MDITKDKSIEDTGERMIPAYHKGRLVYGEHIVRYKSTEAIVKDKVVLDIAAGSGYGTAVIGESAKKVYGVDVDKDAITYAQKNYSSKTVEFIKGNGKDIPLDTDTVDVVVSFETIEHIEDYKHFMSEVRRVLKDDGIFVLSTPNDVEFPEGAHFHIHEFERAELKALAKEYFQYSKEYFQATWKYNALLDEEQLSEEWDGSLKTLNVAPVSPKKAIYFYMLLSNRKITESIEPLGAISEHWSDRDMLTHNQDVDQYIRKTMAHYEGILAEKEEQISGHLKQISKLSKELERIKGSFAHKTLSKLKAAKIRLRSQ